MRRPAFVQSRLHAGFSLAFPLTVCVAALLAHLAIDAVGDVALARDAYDGVAHDSRGMVLLVAACFALAAGIRLVVAALDAVGGRARLGAVARWMPRSRFAFIATAAGATVVVLAAMETLDSVSASGRVEDLADAFGGSLALGLGTAIPIAVVVAALAWRGLCWLATARPEIVRAIAGLLGLRPRLRVAPAAVSAGHRLTHSRERAVRARTSGKRGPPTVEGWLAYR